MMSLSYQSNTEGTEDKLTYPWRKLGIAFAVMMFIALLAAGVGAVNIHPLIILKILMSKLPFVHIEPNWQHTYETILLQIRIPRGSLSCLVGGTLAISGAAYQGLFRNPLADPGLVGVSSGAAVAAVVGPPAALVHWRRMAPLPRPSPSPATRSPVHLWC